MSLPAFRIAQTEGGVMPSIAHYPVAAGSTFLLGDVVRLLNDGTIVVAADNDAAALGTALADGAANVGKNIPVAMFSATMIFSAVNSGSAYTAAARGDLCSLDITTGVHSIVVGTAGNGLFDIVGEDTTDSSRVLVRVPVARSQAPGYGSAAPD